MLYLKDNRFGISDSPHSMGLRNNLTIPGPGWDTNPLILSEKATWSRGFSGLSMDGTGLFGTGLFAGDSSQWGTGELVFGAIGFWMVSILFSQTKKDISSVKRGLVRSAQDRRYEKAKSLRAEAKRLQMKKGLFF
jgi:hypothetical protein